MSLLNADFNSTAVILKTSGMIVQCHFSSTWASSTVIIDIIVYRVEPDNKNQDIT